MIVIASLFVMRLRPSTDVSFLVTQALKKGDCVKYGVDVGKTIGEMDANGKIEVAWKGESINTNEVARVLTKISQEEYEKAFPCT